jgi:hypothetical protein
MPIIRTFRTKRQRRAADEAARAAFEAHKKNQRSDLTLTTNQSISSSRTSLTRSYINDKLGDDFRLDPSLEMSFTPDGVPIITHRKQSFMERLKGTIAFSTGLIAVLDAFVFVFLIPFIIAPQVSIILAKYNEQPVMCATSKIEYQYGVSNCSPWSSCRNGCTTPTVNCTLINVHYKPVVGETETDLVENGKVLSGNELDNWHWEQRHGQLYINNDGCGYLPNVRITFEY